MGPKKGVLVIDDDLPTLETLELMLQVSGYQVWTSGYARDAMRLAQQHKPDVILLDLMMPVMDGWEFRRRQVEDPAIAKVPVVVLSALDPIRAVDLGGTAFLKKPLDFDRLLELVRRFCSSPGC